MNPKLPCPPEMWPRFSALLDELLALPLGERSAWLAALPATQAELRAGLAAVLTGLTAGDDGFLHNPPSLPAQGPGDGPYAVQVGLRVGPWRLLREIGAGGMGSVWLADRADGGLKRQVALKLPRVSWVPGLHERLARERDILATLEHPHIAKLYDAGLDEHSRPWLALEYVPGRPIDEHARAKSLDVRQRVQLLLQVCDAVAYAHSRLVIHRDLKPANIVVTEEGQVKLLDFGIAKLLQGDSTEATALTALGGRAMTRDYASPEQVRGDALTTSSDVYSLAVVAYELLAGVRPHHQRRGSAAELEAAIEHADIAPASAAAGVPALRKALKGDLDAILKLALEKSAPARYATVAALHQDLQNHLLGRPLQAQPERWHHRCRRWLQRHHRALGGLAAAALAWLGGYHAQLAVMLALAAGLLAALWQRQQALAQRDAARAERERAAAVQGFLIDIFNTSSSYQADPQRARQVTARALLDIGAQKLEVALAYQPVVRQELASLLSGLYGEMGVVERCLPLARTSVSLAEQWQGRGSPAHLSTLAQLLNELHKTGTQADLQGPLAEAESLLSMPSPRGADARPSAQRADLLLSLAMVREGDQVHVAQQLAQQAEQEARAAGATGLLARALQMQGTALNRMGHCAAAVLKFEEGLRLADAQAGGHDHSVLPARVTLAEAQMQLLRVTEAMDGLRLALADVEHREGPDHMDAWQTRLRLGATLGTAGLHTQATDVLEPLAARLRALGPAQEILLSTVALDLSTNLRECGDLAAAEHLQREALALRERLRPSSGMVARLREDLASTLVQRGAFAEATTLLDRAQALRTANGELPADLGPVRGVMVRIALARAQGDTAAVQRLAEALPSTSLHTTSPTRFQLTTALALARVALDAADTHTAAQRLGPVEEALRRLVRPGTYPALEAPLQLLCGRLAASTGNFDEGERRFAAVEGLLAEVGPHSALRQELAQARLAAAARAGQP